MCTAEEKETRLKNVTTKVSEEARQDKVLCIVIGLYTPRGKPLKIGPKFYREVTLFQMQNKTSWCVLNGVNM